MVKKNITIYSDRMIRSGLGDGTLSGRLRVGDEDDREREVLRILPEQDLVRLILTTDGDMSGTKIKSIMSSPLIVISCDATIEDTARITKTSVYAPM